MLTQPLPEEMLPDAAPHRPLSRAGRKTTATLCVLGWSVFWVFGFLALSADPIHGWAIAGASLFAFAGLVTGLVTYLKLCREIT
ncbi:hypothetical protein [Maritimibacter alkaliphilus]|uniref:hypothetical protein n=1 Tax=Maritimibacter alkaliphilus TaxID=404236 RepID=UPI001C940F68|nr:hypothetical protein [Maritimibacter alkaliphilus]MBY6092812.1 hypothetical protein [Maritimibacter alkaliphilus]